MCVPAKIGKSIKMQFKISFYYKVMYCKHKSPESELHLLFSLNKNLIYWVQVYQMTHSKLMELPCSLNKQI